MNITLAFTTYFSSNYILEQFKKDYFTQSNYLIDEIVIQDDYSDDFFKLKQYESDKIKIFQNNENLSPLLSRINLVGNCKNDWVLLMDSDNFLDEKNFDIIRNLELHQDTIYCPDFARPNFAFKEFSNITMDMDFVKPKLGNLGMDIFLNTGNYLIPKQEYLRIGKNIDTSFSHYTVDVIYYNYLWLSGGNKLQCVKDYEYNHTIRGDSYWSTENHKSKEKLIEVNSLFKK
jgi:hypothetical protein